MIETHHHTLQHCHCRLAAATVSIAVVGAAGSIRSLTLCIRLAAGRREASREAAREAASSCAWNDLQHGKLSGNLNNRRT